MRRLGLLLLIVLPAVAHAQDHYGTRLNWETVEAIIFPDRFLGMQLQVNTSSHGGIVRAHGLSGGYDPDSVYEWLNAATHLLQPTSAPTSPTSILLTPPLRSSSGDSLRLMRRAKGSKWDGRIFVMVDVPGRSDRFDIQAKPYEIQALLHGLQREAALSGFVPDSVASVHADSSLVPVDAEGVEPPIFVHAGRYPFPTLSRTGRVIMEFVIGRDGTPEPWSVHAIYSDHAGFAEWGRDMVVGSLFTPAKLNGEPVRVWVRQSINYGRYRP